MLSILIADDEKLAREDILYKVSRSGFYFKWVIEASSAEEALDMIREHKPDILLTDIMMGEMSGIDLVRTAKSASAEIVTILISGYPEFSFAKEAIALDVIEYLLKPVRQEELTAALSKAVARVMHQRNLFQIPVYFEKSVEYSLDERQKEQLFAFLNGMETNLDFPVAALFPEKANFYQMGILRLSINKTEEGENESFRLYYDRLRQKVQNIIRETGGSWFISLNNFAQNQQITVIAASSELKSNKAEETFAKTFEHICLQVSQKLEVGLHIGVSAVSDSVSGGLLTQARQALDLRLSLESPSNRVFYWSEWEKVASANLPEEDFKLYQCLLAADDLKQTLCTVRRIFSFEVPGMAMHIRMLYVELICILARTCVKKIGGSVVSMLGPECLSGAIIDQFSNREELIESLCRTITTALSQWMAVTADARSVLSGVKSYVENNFTNSELCTNFLSKQFCISLGYLSASYKKEFGMTISKQIINLRMDYAKKLLKETRLNILDISDNCGFNNVSYFMRTFKKYVGCTPNEFREN
ncbi:response regulator [Anaerocolumna sp. AGMB13025]|uniref:response regulator transcription factor n=1 Tax=Anaerocolumna sp. AGMB13025 TaxID=3039116 RepID=UPI00241C91F3|nr:helix-turn-helix domain-containing protein [Anaerocolumna sp. AGMB13025]WFR56531.1 response regulator [Anaerocolumna sp. AGMB13025]